MNPFAHARQQRGLSLAEVADATRLSPRVVKAIDDGRFHDLPAGIFARAYVRAFATAVALDDPAAIESVLPLLPPAADPLSALRDVTARPRRPPRAMPHVRLAAAIAFDAALLLLVSAAIVTTVATTCGLRVGDLLEVAAVPLAVLCATTWVEYFVLLAGINGHTAGEYVFGLPDRQPHAPLSLGAVLHRAAFPVS